MVGSHILISNKMAESSDAIRQNLIGVSDLVQNRTNKVNAGGVSMEEGATGEPEDVLDLADSDEDLIHLAREREALYAPYESKIKLRQAKNLKYYRGAGLSDSGYVDEDPMAANYIFDSEETYLSAALAKNPDPVVYADNTPEGNDLSDTVKTMLQFHADQQVLRRKLQQVTRQHSIYLLGVLKHGWDKDIKDIKTEVRKVQDFVFDPDGCVDAYGDFESWLGERITVSAEKLSEMFPKHKDYIELIVSDRLGTPVTYTEWWEDDMCYVTFKDKVLDKHKNEFWNYPQEETDEFGLPMTTKGRNHFAKSKKPYTFLSVFTLGEQPHDITGLIEQNISNQNLITRRTRQIDFNLSRANNSTAFSENNFNQETAKQAANAWLKGNPVLIPQGGPISEAVKDFPAPTIPEAFFKEKELNIEGLRSNFGVLGITAQKPDEDTTARGMILSQQYDNSRIGGGIGEAIEQVANNVFNWWVQLYMVFYDQPHFGAVLGQLKAAEYVELTGADIDRQLIVTVQPDSTKPVDELTKMNQAQALLEAGWLDPKTYFTIANFPDPQETAAQVTLWKLSPQTYMQMNFPDIAQLIAATNPGAAPVPGAPAPGGAPAVPGAEPSSGQPPEGAPSIARGLATEPASAALSQVSLPK